MIVQLKFVFVFTLILTEDILTEVLNLLISSLFLQNIWL